MNFNALLPLALHVSLKPILLVKNVTLRPKIIPYLSCFTFKYNKLIWHISICNVPICNCSLQSFENKDGPSTVFSKYSCKICLLHKSAVRLFVSP